MVKKIIYIFTTLFIMTACDVEMSNNGKLDGLWQMTEMQVTGEEAIDMRETGTIWAFQFRLLELRNKINLNGVLCRFEQNGDNLRVYEPREQKHMEYDRLITDSILLVPFGLNTTDEDFRIETLTSSHMVLVSKKARVRFRKY